MKKFPIILLITIIALIVITVTVFKKLQGQLTPTLGDLKTVTLAGGIEMTFVYIEGGTFQMGSASSEKSPDRDEYPVHDVKLTKGFWLGQTEVTQAQWQAVMGPNPSRIRGENKPVEMVSWYDATAFCEKLSKLKSGIYKLPTEAQWEYACRAGSTTDYCFGNDDDLRKLGDYAWYASNSSNETHPVGTKRANDWGLYDMHGNVLEWCQDWFDSSYYSRGINKNPLNDTYGDEEARVLRGGSWYNSSNGCRSARRRWYSPDESYYYLGFRVCLQR